MINLVETFSEFKAGKNIDRPTMVRVLRGCISNFDS